MNAWPGKIVIGLTGNIATGKSVVRKMLEEMGAYGIDADALAHRVILPDTPGYQAVVQAFGDGILAADGQIDRSRLGQIVFSNPQALSRLEAIVHPLVIQTVGQMIQNIANQVIVIEAIKLIEAGLNAKYDSLWVTYAPQAIQLARLIQDRGMDAHTAGARIASQSPQEQKIALADVVIDNSRSLKETRRQVLTAWQGLFQK